MGFALGAYLLWGFAPIYWKQLGGLDASEILAYRVLGSLALALVLTLATGRGAELRAALAPAGPRWLLAGSARCIARSAQRRRHCAAAGFAG